MVLPALCLFCCSFEAKSWIAYIQLLTLAFCCSAKNKLEFFKARCIQPFTSSERKLDYLLISCNKTDLCLSCKLELCRDEKVLSSCKQ